MDCSMVGYQQLCGFGVGFGFGQIQLRRSDLTAFFRCYGGVFFMTPLKFQCTSSHNCWTKCLARLAALTPSVNSNHFGCLTNPGLQR